LLFISNSGGFLLAQIVFKGGHLHQPMMDSAIHKAPECRQSRHGSVSFPNGPPSGLLARAA